jgi:CheY-like chemotaxis protein
VRSFSFLIIEDHPFQRQMLQRVLRLAGAEEVRVASSPLEAVEMLGQMPVDIVVADLMPPDMEGIELIPMLSQKAPDVAVIFCSSDPSLLDTAVAIAQAHGIRALGGLEKPVNPDRLRALMAAFTSTTEDGAS